MNDLPPLLRDQRKADADHLKLLAIFHFIMAGLAVFGIVFLILHYTIMSHFLFNPKMWEGQKSNPPPQELFHMLKWFYLIFGVIFIAGGVANLISGLSIRARKHRMFSLVIAGINCIQIPFGTTLGVFTIIVLIRDSVREVYEAQDRQ